MLEGGPKLDLVVDNVSFAYASRSILENISFHIQGGDFVGIIGPNGSGKSTLLKNMSRVLVPQGGAIYLGREDLEKMPRSQLARKVAVVPQETMVNFAFTVEEVVLMGRTPHLGRFQWEGPEDRQVARKAMEATGILPLADRPITTLSGGERQRAIIAQALAQQPRVLLLDEPTSHLDINHQVEIFELLRALSQKEQVTVIAVLHDLNLAAQYCDYLILLSEGRVFALGSPARVLTPENVAAVYGTEVLVDLNPATNRPWVLIKPRREPVAMELKIHVIGGGGTVGQLLEELYRSGLHPSIGVINIGDSDWQTAQTLGMTCIEEKPFSHIGPEAHRQNLAMIEGADLVILGPVPWGPGNLLNLAAVEEALRLGKEVIVLGVDGIRGRDFTDNEAWRRLEEVIRGGAVPVASIDDVLDYLRKRGQGES
ncbi:MAG: heme ABC transporter ATP-binding protein [Firmicutes bacterium]|nr:heme ABC transporter ATP-binding protein [Bacillota bacterium]